MSDENNSVASQIDAMVSAANSKVEQAGRYADPSGTKGHVIIKLTADGADVQSTVQQEGRLHDDNRDLNQELHRLASDINAGQAALDEQIFDTRTGAPSPKLSGDARRVAQLLNDQARVNYQYSQIQFARLEAQRENDRKLKDAEQNERFAELAFTGGDPARKAAWNKALLQKEAETAVSAAMARRFEAGRS